jgi:thioredoxin reductase (NADPH)
MSVEIKEIENVVICGSGPAGYTAALYAARANLEPLILEGMQPGGQLTITTDVENFPGFEDGIMGPELMTVMRKQVERFGTRLTFDEVVECDLNERPFTLKTANGVTLKTKALIIATGASARYLGLENEIRLQGYGVSACATCDGFFYGGEEIAVVGGGDSACEEAHFLTKFATTVHLLVRRSELRASQIMQDRVKNNPKIKIHWHTEVLDVLGDKLVDGIKVINNKTNEERNMAVAALFLAIGHTPNSQPFVPFIDHDESGYLNTVPGSSKTNMEGVFACGDVQDHEYRQAVTAAGSGCMAAIDCERWLDNNE